LRCIAFHSRKEPARKNTRTRAGSLKSFRQPLWNASNAFYHKSFPLLLPPESPRRVNFSRLLLIKKFLFQSVIIPNCPVLTVDIYGLFLKNKMQGILTGLIKLYTLKSSRKISTLIFGQRQQAFFYLITTKDFRRKDGLRINTQDKK